MRDEDSAAETRVLARQGAASTALTALVDRFGDDEHVRLGDIVARLGPAGIGLTVLILSLPALIPLPGPFGMVFGTCLSLVAVQMMFGVRRLWLPRLLAERRVPIRFLRQAITHALPWLGRMERLTQRRRLRPLTRGSARMAIGVPVFLLAVAVALPIPLGNLMPVVALVAIALAILEQDGLALLVALLLSVVALAWVGALFVAGAGLVDALWRLTGMV